MAMNEKDACYQILSFGLWRNLVVYNARLLLAMESYLNYFEEPYIPPLKKELHVEVNIVLEDYVEVKEKKYRDLWGN